MSSDAWQPVYPPVDEALHPIFTVALLAGGFTSVAMFTLLEAGADGKKHIAEAAVLALMGSVLLGFGTLFLLLWCGVYI